MRRQDIQVFSKEWFVYYQQPLLWMANSSIGRSILGIDGRRSQVRDNKIARIEPNNIKWINPDGSITAEFGSIDKFSFVLDKRFKYFWKMIHWWDMNVANPLHKPEWNMGLDEYTGTSDIGTGGDTCDGDCSQSGGNYSWATVRGAGGNVHHDTNLASEAMKLKASGTTGQFTQMSRGINLFDTSSIGTGATVTAASLSLYYGGKKNELGDDSLHVCSSAPASDGELANGDYDSLGATSYGSVAYASFLSGQYSEITFNSDGRDNVAVDGISYYGTRGGWDINNSFTGTWVIYDETYMFVRSSLRTPNGEAPTLDVTYTAGSTGWTNVKTINNVATANVKTVNDVAVANVKSVQDIT